MLDIFFFSMIFSALMAMELVAIHKGWRKKR